MNDDNNFNKACIIQFCLDHALRGILAAGLMWAPYTPLHMKNEVETKTRCVTNVQLKSFLLPRK